MCRIKTTHFGATIIGSNMSEATNDDGTVVLYSYDTPVAAKLVGGRVLKTRTFYSNTTSTHVNKWGARDAEAVEQNVIDAFARGESAEFALNFVG